MKNIKDLIFTLLLTGLMTLVILLILSKIFIPKYIDHAGNRMQYIIKGF